MKGLSHKPKKESHISSKLATSVLSNESLDDVTGLRKELDDFQGRRI